jgi:hypothetical protein
METRLYHQALRAISSVSEAGNVSVLWGGSGVEMSGMYKQSSKKRTTRVFEAPGTDESCLTVLSDKYGIAFGRGRPPVRPTEDFEPIRVWPEVSIPKWAIRPLDERLVRDFKLPYAARKLYLESPSVVTAKVEDIPECGFFLHEDPDEDKQAYRPVPAIQTPVLDWRIGQQGHLEVFVFNPKRDEDGEPVAYVSVGDYALYHRKGARVLNHLIVPAESTEHEGAAIPAVPPVGGARFKDGDIWYWTLYVRPGRSVYVISDDHPDQTLTIPQGFYVLRHRAPSKGEVD